MLGVKLCNSSLCCYYYVTGCLKRQLSVLVQQISERRLIVESHNGRHFVHQTCLPANVIVCSRLLATKDSPPAGEVAKLVEVEKSETKLIEKKSLDIGTDASPVEKKPITDKQTLHDVVMEKKSLMTEEEQQSKKTSMLKEVVNKGIIFLLALRPYTGHGLLIPEVSRSHNNNNNNNNNNTSQLLGLL